MSNNPCDYSFPVAPGDVPYWQPGMTLRDWFAGQALVGLLAGGMGCRTDMLVDEPYRIADAMIDARAKGGTE